MKKKEMAALFDELGETACQSRVMAFGKLPNGLAAESLEMMERRGNDGRAAGRPAERRECRREQGGCRKAACPCGHGKVMHGNECGKRRGEHRGRCAE